MLKLKRLKIDQFRNVAPGTELHFRDSVNVVLGKNGTGKTTLLNLIVSILSWNFEQFLGEPFSIEYELEASGREAVIRLSNELSREMMPLTQEVQMLIKKDLLADSDRYEASGEILLRGEGLESEQAVSFEGTKLRLENSEGAMIDERDAPGPVIGELLTTVFSFLIAHALSNNASPEALIETLMQIAVSRLRRFDESLGYLNHMAGTEESFNAFKGPKGYFVHAKNGGPEAVVQEIMRHLQETPDADEIRLGTDDKDAEFLGQVSRLLGFQAATLRLQRTARQTKPFESVSFGNLRFDLARRDRSVVSHTLLSYGQKRLLSFYYYLASNPDCVVADELVNGMHHEWIEACLDELGERQSFLTSQNPLLLDYLGFQSSEEVRSSFVLCRAEAQGDREVLRWENMTAEDAEGFFSAYQVGIQHVSEILRTRGLW